VRIANKIFFRTLAMDKKDKQQDFAIKRAKILELVYKENMSERAVARTLKMARKTVAKVIRGEEPLRPGPGPERPGRALDAYGGVVKNMLDSNARIHAPTVLQQLRGIGYTGGLTVIRDELRRLRESSQSPSFLTLSFQPGSAAQVDWADFGFALPGCARRVSCFVMVLCHSRYLYIEFTLSQTMGSFLRCMEHATAFFGGVTEADVFDNMKTVVTTRTTMGPVFNRRFIDYACARGFSIVACNVASGNEKGRVERPIHFIRDRFWPTVRASDLLSLNVQAVAWRDTFANNREHAVTGKVPALVFENEEQKLLKPLNGTPFNADDIETLVASKMFRVRFDRNSYSVPPHLVGQKLLLRACDDRVRVFLGPKEVACHRRSWSVHQDIEDPSHRLAALAQKIGETKRLPPVLSVLGEAGMQYAKILGSGTRSVSRELRRMIFLVEVFGPGAVIDAMNEVMRSGHVGAEFIEYVLRYKNGSKPQCDPLRLGDPRFDDLMFADPDLELYDRLVGTVKTINPLEARGDNNGEEQS
jgi:transposase